MAEGSSSGWRGLWRRKSDKQKANPTKLNPEPTMLFIAREASSDDLASFASSSSAAAARQQQLKNAGVVSLPPRDHEAKEDNTRGLIATKSSKGLKIFSKPLRTPKSSLGSSLASSMSIMNLLSAKHNGHVPDDLGSHLLGTSTVLDDAAAVDDADEEYLDREVSESAREWLVRRKSLQETDLERHRNYVQALPSAQYREVSESGFGDAEFARISRRDGYFDFSCQINMDKLPPLQRLNPDTSFASNGSASKSHAVALDSSKRHQSLHSDPSGSSYASSGVSVAESEPTTIEQQIRMFNDDRDDEIDIRYELLERKLRPTPVLITSGSNTDLIDFVRHNQVKSLQLFIADSHRDALEADAEVYDVDSDMSMSVMNSAPISTTPSLMSIHGIATNALQPTKQDMSSLPQVSSRSAALGHTTTMNEFHSLSTNSSEDALPISFVSTAAGTIAVPAASDVVVMDVLEEEEVSEAETLLDEEEKEEERQTVRVELSLMDASDESLHRAQTPLAQQVQYLNRPVVEISRNQTNSSSSEMEIKGAPSPREDASSPAPFSKDYSSVGSEMEVKGDPSTSSLNMNLTMAAAVAGAAGFAKIEELDEEKVAKVEEADPARQKDDDDAHKLLHATHSTASAGAGHTPLPSNLSVVEEADEQSSDLMLDQDDDERIELSSESALFKQPSEQPTHHADVDLDVRTQSVMTVAELETESGLSAAAEPVPLIGSVVGLQKLESSGQSDLSAPDHLFVSASTHNNESFVTDDGELYFSHLNNFERNAAVVAVATVMKDEEELIGTQTEEEHRQHILDSSAISGGAEMSSLNDSGMLFVDGAWRISDLAAPVALTSTPLRHPRGVDEFTSSSDSFATPMKTPVLTTSFNFSGNGTSAATRQSRNSGLVLSNAGSKKSKSPSKRLNISSGGSSASRTLLRTRLNSLQTEIDELICNMNSDTAEFNDSIATNYPYGDRPPVSPSRNPTHTRASTSRSSPLIPTRNPIARVGEKLRHGADMVGSTIEHLENQKVNRNSHHQQHNTTEPPYPRYGNFVPLPGAESDEESDLRRQHVFKKPMQVRKARRSNRFRSSPRPTMISLSDEEDNVSTTSSTISFDQLSEKRTSVTVTAKSISDLQALSRISAQLETSLNEDSTSTSIRLTTETDDTIKKVLGREI